MNHEHIERFGHMRCHTVPMLREDAEKVVAGLRERGVFAHVHSMGVNRVAVRVVLAGGDEAIWDADGAAGLEAQVMREGILVGFVPLIQGSENYSVEQTVEAIASADYGRG